ncbi:MAG: hypothetical protein OXU77_06975 [Gammaproteobacteria bacterium]|nr:hypothetical protein [Gammaproteobacteria bacterium]MDE0443824.1 hypothetical protein [Gammaproteobacteria bacterium]
MQHTRMEAAIIYESHLPDALRRALVYAGSDGFVASLPQLLHARLGASFDNIIWNTWFTANSEECVARTPQGNWVLVVVHGGGIFATPERIRTLYHASVDRNSELGFTGLFAGRISDKENSDLVDGRLPDGRQIPIYAFGDFERGIADLPREYAVVMDLGMAKKARTGYSAFDDLRDDPLMIARAGGTEQTAAYLDRARTRNASDTMGSWHSLNEIEPEQTQSCICTMYGSPGGERARIYAPEGIDHLRGVHTDFGIRGDTGMINMGRYVAVAPRNAVTGVRDLSFGA